MRSLLIVIVDLAFSIAIMGLSLYIILLTHSMVFWELPYVPTMRGARKKLKEVVKLKKSDKVLDLGSGLGRMVLFFAQYPVHVTGIERRGFLAFVSRVRLFFHFWKKGKTTILHDDFFNLNLRHFNLIYAFHIPKVITLLAPKVEKEMTAGSTLISYKFPYPLSAKFAEEKVQDAPGSFFYVYRRKA